MQIDVRKLQAEIENSRRSNSTLKNDNPPDKTIQLVIDAAIAMRKFQLQQGEYVIEGDQYRRIAQVLWPPEDLSIDGKYTLQYAPIGAGCVYLGKHGTTTYSGSLDLPVKRALQFTGEYKLGSAWTFYDGYVGAHRGVYFEVPFRVFRVIEYLSND